MNLIEKSLHIALNAHAGQTDRGGTPYILHPLRLMNQMETENEKATALLHDVVEDSDYTFEDLREENIPGEMITAIQCLTKNEDESYDQFIGRCVGNELARKVKMADIRDNLNVLRLDELDEEDLKRVVKYHRAGKRLDEKADR